MTKLIKLVVTLFIVFIIFSAYWNYKIYRYGQQLHGYSQPFNLACQSQTGCLIAPVGWVKSSISGYSKDRMEYVATKYSFKIKWHIATDVYLVASGGKGHEIKIERDVN